MNDPERLACECGLTWSILLAGKRCPSCDATLHQPRPVTPRVPDLPGQMILFEERK